jgi:hypothetical protein
MAWVQIGKRKINTANICVIEDMGNGVQIWFQNTKVPLELHFEEAKALWRCLKAEDAMGKSGAHQVFAKGASSGDVLDVKEDDESERKPAAPKPPPSPAPVAKSGR